MYRKICFFMFCIAALLTGKIFAHETIPIVSGEFIMQIFMHKNIDGLHNSRYETIVK